VTLNKSSIFATITHLGNHTFAFHFINQSMKHLYIIMLCLCLTPLTAQQAYQVKDLNQGTDSGFPSWSEDYKLLGGLDSVCIFYANGKAGVKLLCSSNGTEVGTISIIPPIGTNEELLHPTVSGNLFWFVIRDASSHDKLYSTDGTWAGTQVRVDETAAHIFAVRAIAGGVVYSRGPDNFDNEELIRVRLTANTVQKTVLAQCYWFGGLMAFAVQDSNTIWAIGAGETQSDRHLFKCTGAANSRTNIAVINTGSEFNNAIFMTVVGTKCFWFWQREAEEYKLWVSDGTAAGTVGLTALEKLSFQELDTERALLAHQGKFYFRGTARGASTGTELWVSDGTLAGTKMIKDIAVGNSNGQPRNLTVYQNRIFFGARTDSGNEKLWLLNAAGTDCTEAYTGFAWNEYYGVDVLPYRDSLVFGGYKAAIGGELMMGALSNTSLKIVSNQSPANDDAFYPTNYVATKKLLFFQAFKPGAGRELWAFDPLRTSTSAFEPMIAERLEVSPNPATDLVRIALGSMRGADCNIEVFSSTGQQIYTQKADITDSFTMLYIGDWPSGMYQIVVRAADGTVGVAQVVK
jgi:ELWxxDGT repeat protein